MGYRTVATRYYRWLHSGLWRRLIDRLQSETDARGALDWDVHMVGGTNVRAHRHAAGARGGIDPSQAEAARAGIAERLPILSPEDDEERLPEAGFRGISPFYVGFAFRGWVAYA
jgi:hypothetical protein